MWGSFRNSCDVLSKHLLRKLMQLLFIISPPLSLPSLLFFRQKTLNVNTNLLFVQLRITRLIIIRKFFYYPLYQISNQMINLNQMIRLVLEPSVTGKAPWRASPRCNTAQPFLKIKYDNDNDSDNDNDNDDEMP